jgi:hypothetical protein
MSVTLESRRTIVVVVFVAVALMSATLIAAESAGERYIVILKSRKGLVPYVAKLGGAVTFRQDDQLIVAIPPAAITALRAAPLVRYIQPLAGGSPLNEKLIGEPAEPSPGAPRRLVPHADAGNLSWSRQYLYDDAGTPPLPSSSSTIVSGGSASWQPEASLPTRSSMCMIVTATRPAG